MRHKLSHNSWSASRHCRSSSRGYREGLPGLGGVWHEPTTQDAQTRLKQPTCLASPLQALPLLSARNTCPADRRDSACRVCAWLLAASGALLAVRSPSSGGPFDLWSRPLSARRSWNVDRGTHCRRCRPRRRGGPGSVASFSELGEREFRCAAGGAGVLGQWLRSWRWRRGLRWRGLFRSRLR
jgi:hypothetical protein